MNKVVRTWSLAALAVLTSALSPSVGATPLPPAAHAEVEALMARLKASPCQFNRNGSWYSGAEASTHLLRKLSYLEDKQSLKSAEEFIALGAARSSSSGKAYLVKCPDAAAVESALWLNTELKQLRSKH
jgi:hypothetical protein